MFYAGNKEFEDKDVMLTNCELIIDCISKLPVDIQLDVLSELHGYLTKKN